MRERNVIKIPFMHGEREREKFVLESLRYDERRNLIINQGHERIWKMTSSNSALMVSFFHYNEDHHASHHMQYVQCWLAAETRLMME